MPDGFDDDEPSMGDPMDYAALDEPRPTVHESLVRMLSAAWRSWFGNRGEPVALLGQLLDIARNTPEGRAGRPADAVGVSPATWNKWVLGARQMPGGSSPNAANRARIARVVRDIRMPDNADDVPTPTVAVVTAVIVWNRYQNGRTDRLKPQEEADMSKVRTTRFDDLDLDDSRRSWIATQDRASAQDLLDALEIRYGVPIELYNVESLELED